VPEIKHGIAVSAKILCDLCGNDQGNF